MMLNDSLFSDAGWFFFAIWSIVIGILSIAAFGCDLRSSRATSESKPRRSM